MVFVKPIFYMSGNFQTIGDFTVSRPSQTFPTNENWKSSEIVADKSEKSGVFRVQYSSFINSPQGLL